MAITSQIAKAGLRREIRARLEALTPAQRTVASAAACERLRAQPIWQQARSILFYAPLPGELDLWPLLREAVVERKVVALPRFLAESRSYMACQVQDLSRDIIPGQYSIREPAAACPPVPLVLDLILVPGLAFDLQGRRLGRGKGFYDQLLAAARGTTCGVAFDEQIVAEVPVEEHDIRLSCILTPSRWTQR